VQNRRDMVCVSLALVMSKPFTYLRLGLGIGRST
jgi:hypothetical protein